MGINENRNNEIQNSRVFLPQPVRFLQKEEFQNYVDLVKQIANFDPSSKKWYISNYKVERLSKDELKEIADRLSGYIGDSIYLIISDYLKDSNNIIRAKIHGNYLYVYDDINKYRNLLTYKIKSFDYRAGQYTEQEILLAWVKGNYFVTLRGLFWKLKTLSNINLEPFTNLQFYDITLKNFQMREYQLNAVKSWIEDANSIGSGIIKAPTGSGKSIIAILSTIQMLRNKPNAKIIYAVNSTTLLRQFQQFAKKEDLEFLLVSGEVNELNRGQKSNLIALSLAYYYSKKKHNQHEKLKEIVSDADLIIIDEAHHLPANSIKALLQDAPNSIRLGLSATPYREDGKEMEIIGFLGRISYSIEYTQLVKGGYLTPIEYITFIPKIPKKLKEKLKILEKNKDDENFAKYYATLLRLFENSPNTNKQIIEKILELNQYPALVIVRRITMAKKLTELIKQYGISVDYVTSKTPLEQRMEKIENLKNGKLQLLISTSLADEGLDIPNLKMVVLLSQGKSRIKLVQRIGRVMRPFKNKSKGYVLDVSYNHDIFLRQLSKRLKFIQSEYNGIIMIDN